MKSMNGTISLLAFLRGILEEVPLVIEIAISLIESLRECPGQTSTLDSMLCTSSTHLVTFNYTNGEHSHVTLSFTRTRAITSPDQPKFVTSSDQPIAPARFSTERQLGRSSHPRPHVLSFTRRAVPLFHNNILYISPLLTVPSSHTSCDQFFTSHFFAPPTRIFEFSRQCQDHAQDVAMAETEIKKGDEGESA